MCIKLKILKFHAYLITNKKCCIVCKIWLFTLFWLTLYIFKILHLQSPEFWMKLSYLSIPILKIFFYVGTWKNWIWGNYQRIHMKWYQFALIKGFQVTGHELVYTALIGKPSEITYRKRNQQFIPRFIPVKQHCISYV